jgi:hypothetical protein
LPRRRRIDRKMAKHHPAHVGPGRQFRANSGHSLTARQTGQINLFADVAVGAEIEQTVRKLDASLRMVAPRTDFRDFVCSARL